MTTDLQIRRAADVYVNNDVLRVRPDATTAGLQLAGAAWLASGDSPRRAHQRSLGCAVSLVVANLAGYTLWLIAGHSAWQPNSRIAQHRRFWGSLKAQGLAKPFGRDSGEGLIETPDGVRFFAALQLGLGSLEPVVAVLEAEPASHLIALKLHDEASPPRLLAEAGIARSRGRAQQ